MRVQMAEVGRVPPYLSLLFAADSLKVNSLCTRSLVYKGWLKGMKTSLSPLCFELEQIRDHFII